MNQTTFEFQKGNNPKEKGIFLSLNGPSILKKKTMAEISTTIVNDMNKGFMESKLNMEIKFDTVESYIKSLVKSYSLEESVVPFIKLSAVHVKDSLVVTPLNMFSTLLLYGFYVNHSILENCTVAIIEGYGTFRFFNGRVSFAPEVAAKDISITTKIQTDEY